MREVGAPIEIRHFASPWRVSCLEDHPLQDLLFAMMRSRGVHILDNFPCFLTSAHSAEDIAFIQRAFKDSVAEMQESGFLPRRARRPPRFDVRKPVEDGCVLARDIDGQPFWYVPEDAASISTSSIERLRSMNAVLKPTASGAVIECIIPTTKSQREVWLGAALSTEASMAYNEVGRAAPARRCDCPAAVPWPGCSSAARRCAPPSRPTAPTCWSALPARTCCWSRTWAVLEPSPRAGTAHRTPRLPEQPLAATSWSRHSGRERKRR